MRRRKGRRGFERAAMRQHRSFRALRGIGQHRSLSEGQSAEQPLQQFISTHALGLGDSSQNARQSADPQWVMNRHGHMVLGWGVTSQPDIAA